MPGTINWEPPASSVMILKKRKRDNDSGQDSNMVLSPPSQMTYPRAEAPSISSGCSRANLGSPTSKPRIRPLVSSLKKRRLDPKIIPSQPSQPLFFCSRTSQEEYTEENLQHARNHHSMTPTSDDYTMKNMSDAPRHNYGYHRPDDEHDRSSCQQTGPISNRATRGDSQILSPCHICHRRPTTRTALDAYADCEICGKRACYVCLRECDDVYCQERGSNIDRESHRTSLGRRICSSCAVEGILETGEEVVRCLVCVEHG
ncbi:conserved hypothetical protein [Microsporum canis CBS 113480]|uniref:Uncharacterized protein n=1 Tax=Arthroderma otae (strain ATCC MYA-4605 / CBS 113480) TaxID=554155 RepID=C5FYX6_ARTOC|nr:conserved hypothetical protein [Microsporum canis CBS 113480]EEQ34724.1 conserved hypothetical protein [Microsporum canis CBS 113480]